MLRGGRRRLLWRLLRRRRVEELSVVLPVRKANVQVVAVSVPAGLSLVQLVLLVSIMFGAFRGISWRGEIGV